MVFKFGKVVQEHGDRHVVWCGEEGAEPEDEAVNLPGTPRSRSR